jgi:glycine/D-amino acid oxidase-like deaminating enzyme
MRKMSEVVYDVIIVGGGIEGSSVGYYLCSRETKNVLLIEQVQHEEDFIAVDCLFAIV